MGAWGFEVYESDDGLDIKGFIDNMLVDQKEVHLQNIIEKMRAETILDEDEDFIYDNGILVLAEVIVEYKINNGLKYSYFDEEDDNYIEDVFTGLVIIQDDIDFVLEEMTNILDSGVERELHSLWEETDDYEEWKKYVNDLINEL